MKVEHVSFEEDGAATILVSRSKSDVAGDGRLAYLSAETAALLSRWLDAAELQTGPLSLVNYLLSRLVFARS